MLLSGATRGLIAALPLLLFACIPSTRTDEDPPPGVTIEALPSSTPTGLLGDGAAETQPDTSSAPAGTPTPLIGVTPRPTAIPFFTPLPATPTAPVTDTPAPGAAAGGVLTIDDVRFVHAVRDPSRDNGAIATFTVEFFGGAAPYTVLDEEQAVVSGQPMGAFERGGQAMFWIEFTAETTCEAAFPRRVGVVSADGQAVELEYWVDRVVCSD